MKKSQIRFAVIVTALNLGFIACGGHMKNVLPSIMPPVMHRVVNFAHRAVPGSSIGQNRGVEQLAMFLQAGAPTVTQSFEGRCTTVPDADVDLALEGAGRFNDDTKCAQNFVLQPLGAPVISDGTLSGLYCFGQDGAFPDSGTIKVMVVVAGATTLTDTGISCVIGQSAASVVQKDITHTFAVHAGDQVVLQLHAKAGDTLQRVDAFVGE